MTRWSRIAKSPKRLAARALGYRSGLEVEVTNDLTARGIPFDYEAVRVPFVSNRTQYYLPDIILPNGLIVETKGEFATKDRTKHLMVRAAHPNLDIRFVFSRSSTLIGKASKTKTTYAKWCKHKGFLFSDKHIPQAWLDEPVNTASLAALELLKRK